ncbi:OmpA family protein [Psychrobium sp. MM17-31]|uniref:OmpA family protein n=1 Tax=Psychrobium sp. MM17-31 TaxID=2917758 RepID=UPI001EF60128|nr:OmpA family protein [Psychrobium sp. MM17-31]MCG7533233.1 OmpA family protein [Psychrobium sp. MM17-31]
MKSMTKKLTAVIVASATLTLGACQTVDPYTGESRTNKATTYGLGAAVVCALIGSKKNSKHARNAGLGCGAIGAGIGAYMDSQEAEIRKEMQGTGVQVQRDGDKIRLIMPGNITFKTGKYDISPNFYNTLDGVARVLAKFKDTRLMVAGHADSTGNASFNQTLSANRAQSVAGYLQQRGINAGRLMSRGFGSSMPIASNETAQGRQANRRVELDIVANPQ